MEKARKFFVNSEYEFLPWEPVGMMQLPEWAQAYRREVNGEQVIPARIARYLEKELAESFNNGRKRKKLSPANQEFNNGHASGNGKGGISLNIEQGKTKTPFVTMEEGIEYSPENGDLYSLQVQPDSWDGRKNRSRSTKNTNFVKRGLGRYSDRQGRK